MGLEKFRHKPEYDEEGNEINTSVNYTNISALMSNIKQHKTNFDYSDITNRRIAIKGEDE